MHAIHMSQYLKKEVHGSPKNTENELGVRPRSSIYKIYMYLGTITGLAEDPTI